MGWAGCRVIWCWGLMWLVVDGLVRGFEFRSGLGFKFKVGLLFSWLL